jgi:hypothetical protein
MAIPTRGSATSASQIQILWTTLTTAAETGSSTILSYNLYWDNGLGGDPAIQVTDTLVTSFIINGLTTGHSYRFKVRAKNIYSYGSFSPVVAITPTSVPDTMSAPTTAIDGLNTNIDITWTAPTSDGGSSITNY